MHTHCAKEQGAYGLFCPSPLQDALSVYPTPCGHRQRDWALPQAHARSSYHAQRNLSSFGAHSWLSVDIQHVGGASSPDRLRRVFSDASAGFQHTRARHSWSRSLPAELSHSFADSALPLAAVSSARSRTSSALHPASVFAEVELEPFRHQLVHAQDTFFRASDSEHSMSVEVILNLQVQIQTLEQMCSSCRCKMFSKYDRHAETSHMM